MPSRATCLFLAACCAGGAGDAVAHHSFGEYDQTTLVEIEGTIAEVRWQNPHVRLSVQAGGELWDLESGGANQLRRMGIDEARFEVGRRVKVAGYPSRRRAAHLYTAHMLQDDGQELVLFRNLTPRWTQDAIGFGTASDPERAATSARAGNPTVFGVWGSQLSDPDMNPGALARGSADYPYTPAARNIREEWLKERRPPLSGCTPKGMPLIMEQPFPIELVDRGTTILLRLEEYDTERTIWMDTASPAPAPEPTPLGSSSGRWEGRTLVVETVAAQGEFLDQLGTPQGPNARFVERFTPSADGTRLNYTLTVTDPDTFTAPVEMRRSWIARPGERLLPFRCTE